jgi:hypothetical protein
MPQFKDTTGHTWDVAITHGLLRRCKAAGFDLADHIRTPERFAAMMGDRLAFGEALAWACGLPTDPARRDEFWDRIDGPAEQAAAAALTEVYLGFTVPPSGVSAAMAGVQADIETVTNAIKEEAAKKVDRSRTTAAAPSSGGGPSPAPPAASTPAR